MTGVAKLMAAAADVAMREAARGVREEGGPNRGRDVARYLAAVGLRPGYPWCAAFVYWCFTVGSLECGVRSPVVRTAGALAAFRLAPKWARVVRPRGPNSASLASTIPVGSIVVINHGHGRGHCGIVVPQRGHLERAAVQTVEGNTNPDGHRDGDGVWTRQRRVAELMGWVDYSRATKESTP